MRPAGLIKLAYLPSATINVAVGLPTSRIDENPGIRGTRSLLRQDVPIKLPRKTCSSRLRKTVRIMTGQWRDVTL